MNNIISIFKRELKSYFSTPLAPVFLIVFLVLSGFLTFRIGQFYERGQADLVAFFVWHPWLYLFLVPAISMRLWSEERSTGTIEVLLTMPISLWEAIIGKFLAAWAFIGIALSLTFPLVITVKYLGNPDLGIILASYLGSFLMAGAYLALGCCLSGITKNQVIAFILSVVSCLLFILIGFNPVIDIFLRYLPDWLVNQLNNFSFITHFSSIQRGVIDLRDIIFFVSFIVAFLFAGTIIIDKHKAD